MKESIFKKNEKKSFAFVEDNSVDNESKELNEFVSSARGETKKSLNLFLFAIEHVAYFHYWVSKKLFFVLMEQKDKRLNQPEILEKLVQNYALIIKKMI